MYTIRIAGKNRKIIGRLDPLERKRLIAAIDALAENPRPKGKKIKSFHGVSHGYRLRVGSLRVLYVVDDTHKEVSIIKVGKRGDIY